jgi:hypothetical protein
VFVFGAHLCAAEPMRNMVLTAIGAYRQAAVLSYPLLRLLLLITKVFDEVQA